MANLKEIRGRIVSVNSTRQITSAMKMVSAAKLKKAQDAVLQMRPYSEKLQEILGNLSSSLDSSEGVYSSEREIKNILIVAITSNRGLCGGFNNNIIKKVNSIIADNKDKGVVVLSIGKKASEFYKHTSYNIKASDFPKHLNEVYDGLSFNKVAVIAENVMRHYVDKSFDKVILVYNRFKNAAVQEIMSEQFLPIVPAKEVQNSKTNLDYIFEPSKKEIVEDIIPKSLKVQFYKALLDSFASEHGARMTAMHKATDNATDLIRDLKITYNKARQASITNEILEIVAGAEALKG
ncbi:MAG: ATP synthase F1 subunit gamma [Bacteroidota bacterium]